MFNNIKPNFKYSVAYLIKTFKDFNIIYGQKSIKDLENDICLLSQCKPLSGNVKFNYDAIVLDNNSTIAIVARAHNGKVMQIWSILLKKLIV